MGTNYYMMTKNKKLAHSCFEMEYEIVDEPDFGYQIHLNKLSWGWRPLFQRHNVFQTWDELEKFYYDHSDDLDICDEYGTYYSFLEYKQKIFDHASREPEPIKWVYDFNPFDLKHNPELARKTLLTERCEPEEAELWIPINHVEYFETERAAKRKYKAYSYYTFDDIKYWNDPNYPIDWTEGDFS